MCAQDLNKHPSIIQRPCDALFEYTISNWQACGGGLFGRMVLWALRVCGMRSRIKFEISFMLYLKSII